MEFAGQVFDQELVTTKSGNTVGSQLRQVAKTMRLPEDHFAPKGTVPPGLEYIWEVFIELCNSRPTGFAPSSIPFTEMLAWTILTGIELDAFDLRVLNELDAKFLKVCRGNSSSTKPQSASDRSGSSGEGSR